ncbi:MAG TPA: butyrate kinase [Clostridiaceae bacterium]
MADEYLILVLNPGSTSTKISLFLNEECLATENLSHSTEEIKQFPTIFDQKDMRTNVILNWLEKHNYKITDLAAVVGRGGLLRPMPGGTYSVDHMMLEDLKIGYQGQHASNLGGIIANSIARQANIPAYIVDPVSVDEYENVARISGMPEIPRKSLVHALNIKAVTRKVCEDKKLAYDNSGFVVAHLGGGITVASLKNGRIIDSVSANDESSFSPERTGGLPVGSLVELAYSGKYTHAEMLRKTIGGKGGFAAYLGTNDGKEVNRKIDAGDKRAEFILEAMAYQLGKDILAMSVVQKGRLNGIILTGGLAYNQKLTDLITARVSFVAPVILVPGENEMTALVHGALRALRGEEEPKIYENEVLI